MYNQEPRIHGTTDESYPHRVDLAPSVTASRRRSYAPVIGSFVRRDVTVQDMGETLVREASDFLAAVVAPQEAVIDTNALIEERPQSE